MKNKPNRDREQFLKILKQRESPTPDELRDIARELDDHRLLVKIWLLEGTPHVFARSSTPLLLRP